MGEGVSLGVVIGWVEGEGMLALQRFTHVRGHAGVGLTEGWNCRAVLLVGLACMWVVSKFVN